MNQGSGIGLSITKEFVKLHNGYITVDSEPEKGSCFTVWLPVQIIDASVPLAISTEPEIPDEQMGTSITQPEDMAARAAGGKRL